MEIKRKMQSLPLTLRPSIPARAYPSFLSMKQQGVSLPPSPDASPSQGFPLLFLPQSFIIQFACTHVYSLVERGSVSILPKNPTHLHGQEKLKGYKIF